MSAPPMDLWRRLALLLQQLTIIIFGSPELCLLASAVCGRRQTSLTDSSLETVSCGASQTNRESLISRGTWTGSTLGVTDETGRCVPVSVARGRPVLAGCRVIPQTCYIICLSSGKVAQIRNTSMALRFVPLIYSC